MIRTKKLSDVIEGALLKNLTPQESLDDLKKLILQKLYWSEVDLKPVSDTQWDVYNSKGKVGGYTIVFKSGRYRLEEIWN